MEIALVVVVLVAAVVVALLLGRVRALRRALDEERAAANAASRRADDVERDRRRIEATARAEAQTRDRRIRELEAGLAEATSTAQSRQAQLDASTSRVAALEASARRDAQASARVAAELDEARRRVTTLDEELARVRTAAPLAGATPGGSTGGAWPLVLSRVERQWAAAVGALPDERGVRGATPAEQLAEAIGREVERLREEAGLAAQLHVEGPATDAGDPAVVLLAVGEVLGVVAPRCDALEVTLGDRVEVAASGWTGEPAELERILATSARAGCPGTIESDGDRVRVAFPGPGAPG